MGNGLQEEKQNLGTRHTYCTTGIQSLLDVESIGPGGCLDDTGGTMQE